jgi:hypothetical protein
MIPYINIFNISKNIFILHAFSKVINKIPELKKYDDDVRFNIYRSLMCLTFTILSFYCFIKHIKMGYSFPYEYHTPEFTELQELFIAYIIYDLYYMLKNKKGRKDLYIHHIFVLIVTLLYIVSGYGGWLVSILIFCEIISIVSGIDRIAMIDKNMKESMMYKKIRKNIIKFIRLPIWIVLFLFTTKYIGRLPNYLIYMGYITVFVMLNLDRYWEKKCDKVISKYKNL